MHILTFSQHHANLTNAVHYWYAQMLITRRDRLRSPRRSMSASSNALHRHLLYSSISCMNSSFSTSDQDDRLIGGDSSSISCHINLQQYLSYSSRRAKLT